MEVDGRITGTLQLPPGTPVVDPLPLLPDAPDMRRQLRTFPGVPNRGRIDFQEIEPGTFAFTTTLPKRFGGIGRTRHGVFAHGGFYPQPIVDGAVPPIHWDVTVELPRTGTVNDAVGTGPVHWEGVSERVSLALPKKARVWTLQHQDARVTVVARRRPLRAFWRHLRKTLPSVGPVDVVLTEAPLRRRLFRTGSGSSLYSDRLFRMTLPFQPFHRPALVEGLLAAHSRLPHPQLRELVGWSRAQAWMKRRKVGGAEGFTRLFTWVPSIDSLLASRRIAFYRDIFREVQLGDAVEDDLVEVLFPHRTGAGVSVQLDDTYGRGTALKIADALEHDLTLAQAFQLEGLDPKLAREWRRDVPEQDYRLQVGDPTTVTREAPEDTPIETIVLKVDGERRPFQLAAGEQVVLERPERITIDPGRHVEQHRMQDAWPVGKLRVTATSWTDLVNLTRFRLIGGLQMTLRGRHDTRNRFIATASTGRASVVSIGLGYRYKFGPLLYGITRRHQLGLNVSGTWIDTDFVSDQGGRYSLSGSLSWSYSNYGGTHFPTHGYGFSAFLGGTIFPDGETRDGSIAVGARGVRSPHPRHAFAGRIKANWSRATREDLLPGLAGPSKMRSLPTVLPCSIAAAGELCSQRSRAFVMAAGEYRWAFLRDLSINTAGIFWASEYQLTLGMEAVVAELVEGPAFGLGGTAGLAVVYDNWGVEPMMIGFTAGWPLYGYTLELSKPTSPVPEIYLRFGQAF